MTVFPSKLVKLINKGMGREVDSTLFKWIVGSLADLKTTQPEMMNRGEFNKLIHGKSNRRISSSSKRNFALTCQKEFWLYEWHKKSWNSLWQNHVIWQVSLIVIMMAISAIGKVHQDMHSFWDPLRSQGHQRISLLWCYQQPKESM